MSYVKLISITQPLIPECQTAEELVAYCARVSNPANQDSHETAPKLLKYLLRNKHWSPLEMVDITIEINTTRDIGRQILRHRSFSFQEFSQRYSDVNDLGFDIREARLQDSKNRQNSIENTDEGLEAAWATVQDEVLYRAKKAYKWALDRGIAKEQARAVLPEGMTMSRMYMKGSLRSWIHYCQIRMDMSTQKEHRKIATSCWELICKKFPAVSEISNEIINETPNN